MGSKVAVIGDMIEVPTATHFPLFIFHDLNNFGARSLNDALAKIIKAYPHGYDVLSRHKKRVFLGFQDIDIFLAVVQDPKEVDKVLSKFLKDANNRIDVFVSCQYEDLFRKTDTFKNLKTVLYNYKSPSRDGRKENEKETEQDDSDLEADEIEIDCQKNLENDDEMQIQLGVIHKHFIKSRDWYLCNVYNEMKRLNDSLNANFSKLKI